jgi:hypothetical protein
VGANVHGHDAIAFDIKHGPQIVFNIHSIDRSSIVRGEAVNLVRTEALVKRVLLKNPPSAGLIPFGWKSGRKSFPKSFRLA